MSQSVSTVIEILDGTPLPNGWRWMKLGEVCTRISNGTSTTQNTEGKGLPVTRIESISSGKINAQKVGWIDSEVEELGRYVLRSGDILFSHINSVERLGNCALYNDTPPVLIHGMNLLRLEVNKELAEPFYLLSFFKSEQARKFYDANARRAIGQASLNTKDLSKLEIPLPALPEQQRIASILTEQMAAVERARAAAEAQLKAAKDLPVAYLRAVFNSTEARGWDKGKLGDHVIKVGSGITPRGGQTAYISSGVPLIRSQNVHLNKFIRKGLAYISTEQDEIMEGSRVQPYDVLLNITGASIGRVCVVPDEVCPANVNQHVSIVRTNNLLDPYFLSFFISSSDFQQFIMDTQAGATRQALTKTLIESFRVPVPPISKQKSIVVMLKEQMKFAEQIKKTLQDQLDTINKLPAALLRQAFTGKL